MDKPFKKVAAEGVIPPKSKFRPESIYSDSFFVMTDNGIAIAYFNFEDSLWHIHHNDYATEVRYWLEEIE
jgi:hypothetical protein